jgi:peptidoglycan/LPS O-acetylase OafA/YrhL
MTKEKHRIFGFDIMRIICALLIFGRHSITMFGCTYGYHLDQIITNLTSPVMTCFFMISGFTLFYQYRDKQIMGNHLIGFYGRRLLTILPSYYLVHISWLVFYRESAGDWLALTPIELVGMQSAYNSLFGILHNGGTWFVSCILFSYLFFPVLQELLMHIGMKGKIISAGIVYFLLVYSNYIVGRFGISGNYSNPVFRMMEFSCGVILASILLIDRGEAAQAGGAEQKY